MGVDVGEEVNVDELILSPWPRNDLNDVSVATSIVQRSGQSL